MSIDKETTHFAPELHIPNGTTNIDFYTNFGATENFCFRNEDGSIQTGAIEIHPTTDHDYGYRQGMFKDPFGHYWQIQKKI